MSDELTVLEAKVSAAHLAVEIAHDSTLDHALKAGDGLLEIIRRDLVKHGQRKALFARTCGASRTGQTYVQLAEHRELLEQTRLGSARLSIAAALRLIRKGDIKPERRTRTSKPEAAAKTAEVKAAKPESAAPDFSGMTDQDWTAALEAIGIDRFLRVMPRGWSAPLHDRALAVAKTKLPAALEEMGFEHFFTNMPKGWRALLNKQLLKPKHSPLVH
jgi:hypothetical protein